MIERSHLIEMFKTLEESGLNTDSNLLWSFFFADHDPEILQTLVPALESRGYRFVDLYEAESEDDLSLRTLYCLEVEKIEKHTVDSLETRNKELRALAEQYGVESFDGIDVGPAESDATSTTAFHESNN